MRVWPASVHVFTHLCRVLTERDQVVIKVADLGGREEFVDFHDGVIWLDHRLTISGACAALFHGLQHLWRGPVGAEQAEAEEARVRQVTARTLVPGGAAYRATKRHWTTREIDAVARRRGVDFRTACDAISLPSVQIPLARAAAENAA